MTVLRFLSKCIFRAGLCRCIAFAGAAALHISLPHPAHAEDRASLLAQSLAGRELWVGAEAYRNVWSLYSGVTWAPAGGLAEDGLRLRLVAGQSAFRYQAATGTARGAAPFGEAFVGYQAQVAATTVKAFAGVWGFSNILEPADAAAPWAHARLGPKLALETWTALSAAVWLSIDGSWSALESAHWSRARLGYRLSPALSVGIEAGQSGTRQASAARVGGLVRYEWAGGEAALSGGIAGDAWGLATGPQARADGLAPYATLLLLLRF
ncbi:MAG: cellulose biosynthesis protein BcsS [Hyphomicrobiaceae bacterium]|nr:cellulose biosynthesis protein BcsS [Hyphomicrobiaceae bacterium]